MKLTKKQQELKAIILDKIYVKGPISRIDISKETGITPATVSKITNDLITINLIQEIGEAIPEEIKSGRKKILLKIVPDHSYYIGLELSEKFLSFCLCDNTGMIQKQKVISHSTTNLSDTTYQNELICELDKFIKECHDFKPKAIGVALPGHFDDVNCQILSNNPFWSTFDLKTIISKINLPFYFKNNVQCMTLSERLLNNNQSDENFTFFHVARGMFCSFMYQGQIYGNQNVLVGEVGHMVVHPNGEVCECGKNGCLQTYASEAWIIKKSQLLYDNSETTYLRQLANDPNKISMNVILQAYKLGDEGVITILHNAIKYLVITINNLFMTIDCHKILVHGELFNEANLVTLLTDSLQQNAQLLSTVEKPALLIKDYDTINGARAACSLCISKYLIG